MNDLNSYINTFLVTNQFSNNFDDSGNIVLNVSASKSEEIFIAVDLLDYNYDNLKIQNLYDVQVTSIPNTTPKISQTNNNAYNNIVQENKELKNKLSELITNSESNSTQSDILAQKDLIIQLRIQLGQGANASEFSTVFPYEKL